MTAVSTIRCADCSAPISEARMAAVPSATRCLECQTLAEEDVVHCIRQPCPRCDRRLIGRWLGMSGDRFFISCTGFPDCRYVAC